jgi:integrase
MSVRKRTWKTAAGDTKEAWIVDYVDQQGDRHIKTFSLKKDANAYADSVGVGVREGTHTPDSKSVTVAEAGRRWIETGEQEGLERTTLEQYRQHLDIHIRPYLGKVKLSQLTAPVVRDFQDKLLSGKPAPGQETAERRSQAMVRKIIGSLGSILVDAQERGLVQQNVVRSLKARRRRGTAAKADKRAKGKLKIGVDIPTPQEIKAIIGALEGHWRPLLLTAIFTGLRASELRGLRWQDVDLGKGVLHVRQRADRFNVIGKPKSEAGERTVPMPPIVANTLKEHRLCCPKGELGLVFPNGNGNVESHANIINRALVPVQIKAGVVNGQGRAKYTGLHALRHFYASWCINRKADGGQELTPKAAQARLGHASIVMTLDRYGHLFPSGDDGGELADAERRLLA